MTPPASPGTGQRHGLPAQGASPGDEEQKHSQPGFHQASPAILTQRPTLLIWIAGGGSILSHVPPQQKRPHPSSHRVGGTETPPAPHGCLDSNEPKKAIQQAVRHNPAGNGIFFHFLGWLWRKDGGI